jgi:hypothetical protein
MTVQDFGGSALSHVSLFTPGWRNERRIQVSGIQASWTINGVGRLSCLIPVGAAPRDRDIRGLFLLWEHPTMGVWAGTIEDLPDDFTGGTLEIGCASMADQLRRRRGPRITAPTRAQAGALARLALHTSQQSSRLWIDRSYFEGAGADILIEWRGDALLSVYQTLQQASGQEWRVSTDSARVTTLEWRKRVGRDLRGSVLIADGYQLGGGRRESSLANVANDLLVIAGSEQWQRRQATTVADRESIRLYGRRQGPVTPIPGAVLGASLRSAGRQIVDELAHPADPTTVILVADNRGGSLNTPMRVREGDTVRLFRAGQETPFDFRVVSRTVDTNAGTATFVGDATPEETG